MVAGKKTKRKGSRGSKVRGGNHDSFGAFFLLGLGPSQKVIKPKILKKRLSPGQQKMEKLREQNVLLNYRKSRKVKRGRKKKQKKKKMKRKK